MKKIFNIPVLAIAVASGITCMAGDIKTVGVGPNQSLVRLEKTDNYIIFPVEESNDDSTVELLVDGKVEKTFYVRLATDSVDYTVPFDLRPYGNSSLVFRVTAPKSKQTIVLPLHASQDTTRTELWRNSLQLASSFDTENTEKYRPVFHHTPTYGWMNDPNGMFYKDGRWHLYYQWNPYGSRWQNMTWGHSSSDDLINWEHHPVAIEPNDLGSIFSGSSAIDRNNTAGFGEDAVIALYTSAGDYQMQSLASSTDGGMTFTNFADNPVLTLPTEARDPNMFFNRETGLWNLVLAHALEKEILIFSSPNLKDWTLESSFGKGLGAREGVWECPDLFELDVDGRGQKKWMMIVNLNPGGPFGGSATQYFIGDFDGKTFSPDKTHGGYVPTKWLDFGKDYYATVSWSDAPDNRRTVIGWMSNWQYADRVPTLQFRSANSLPRDIKLFKDADGQYYAASQPAPELLALREKAAVTARNLTVTKNGSVFELPSANDGICEIELNIESKHQAVEIELSNDEGEKVSLTYDPTSHQFCFDRIESGIVDFNENFPAVTVAPTFERNGSLSLRIFIDRSSIEVFGNGGKFAMTNLVFPSEPYNKLTLSVPSGKARVGSLDIYPLSVNR